MGIVVLPVVLSAILASRGEFLVAAVLGALNLRLLVVDASLAKRSLLIAAATLVALAAVAMSGSVREEGLQSNLDRIVQLERLLDRSTYVMTDDASQAEGIFRPLLSLESSWDRFSTSPLRKSACVETVQNVGVEARRIVDAAKAAITVTPNRLCINVYQAGRRDRS